MAFALCAWSAAGSSRLCWLRVVGGDLRCRPVLNRFPHSAQISVASVSKSIISIARLPAGLSIVR